MDTDNAKKIVEEIFNLIGAPTESVEYAFNEKRGHVFTIKSAAFEVVSTEKEDVARDLVYIIKRLLDKKNSPSEEIVKWTVDINDQQSKADARIKVRALNAAEEARNLKTDVLMDPMSSYERMVVHSTLADRADITTESVGEGRERRLKVKYLSI